MEETFDLIILLGPPQAGKSTTKDLITAATGREAGTCSDLIYEVLAKTLDVEEGDLRDIPKSELRPQLIRLGNALSDLRPEILPQTLLARGKSVIDGVRKLHEYAAFKKYLAEAGKNPLILWIHRDDIPGIVDNTQVTSSHANMIIHNNGSVDDLKETLLKLLTEIGWITK